MRFGDLTVDLARRLVTRGDEAVHLTPTEYALLEALVTNPGKLLTHGWLLRKVWGRGYGTETTYLRTYVRALRTQARGRCLGARTHHDRARRRLPMGRGADRGRIRRMRTGQAKGPTSEVVKRLLLGRAVPSEGLEHTLLPKILALPVFSSDALSSVAYATEEILRVLLIASVTGIRYAMPIAIAIATPAGRSSCSSYRQTVQGLPERRRLLHREQGEPRHPAGAVGRGRAADRLRADGGRLRGRRRVRVISAIPSLQPVQGGAGRGVRRADHAREPPRGPRVGHALRGPDVRVHRVDLHAGRRRASRSAVRRVPGRHGIWSRRRPSWPRPWRRSGSS